MCCIDVESGSGQLPSSHSASINLLWGQKDHVWSLVTRWWQREQEVGVVKMPVIRETSKVRPGSKGTSQGLLRQVNRRLLCLLLNTSASRHKGIPTVKKNQLTEGQ